jgi:serine protease inhibitor
MIDDLKDENKEDYNSIIKRVESLEKVVDELKKFRWQIAAIVSAALIFVGVIPTMKSFIEPTSTVQIEQIKK